MSIKTEDADRLARELAALTNESLTEAVTQALRERLERIQHHRRDRELMRRRLERLVAEYSRLPVVDDRSPEEIIGYDEHGLPR